jgi:hypothetical protein
MKLAKYKLAAFFAHHTGQPLPKPPGKIKDSPGVLLGGAAGRFIRMLMRQPDNFSFVNKLTNGEVRIAMRRMSFCTTVLQSKKGMPRPSKEEVESSVKDTVVKLTTSKFKRMFVSRDKDDPYGLEPGTLSFDMLKLQCRRMVREVYRRKRLSTDDLLQAFMPSLSANYNRTRNQFGTLGHLRDLGLLKGEGDLEMFARYMQLTYAGPGWVNQDGDVVSTQMEEEGIKGTVRPVSLYRMDNYDTLRHKFTTLYFDALKLAMKEEPFVEPVGLPEALKVRVISKGPPLTYFCLKPIQKFMWKVLADHPTFQLVGKPVTEEMLNSVIGAELRSGMAFLSGDYKAATDNLRWELTEAVWEELCKVCCIPESIKELGFRALTQHIFLDGEKQLPQKAGQLMGSIISFPILCIVNATVCAWSMRLTDRPDTPLRDLPLLINGDDCAFQASKECRELWEQIADMAGLETSIGKTYWSPEFLNINSTNFITVKAPTVSVFEREFRLVPYINLGLLYGLKRSGGKVGALELDTDLASRQKDLLKSAEGLGISAHLHQLFLRHNRSALDTFRENRIPFYVPKQYGGVGLEPVEGTVKLSKYRISNGRLERRQEKGWIPSSETPSKSLLSSTMTIPHRWGRTTLDERIVHGMILQLGPQPLMLKEPAAAQLHLLTSMALEAQGVGVTGRWVLSERRDPVTGQISEVEKKDPLDLRPLYLWTLMMTPELSVQETEAGVLMSLLRTNRKVFDWYLKHANMLPAPFAHGIVNRFFLHDDAIIYTGR